MENKTKYNNLQNQKEQLTLLNFQAMQGLLTPT